jgi:hypothetical protein
VTEPGAVRPEDVLSDEATSATIGGVEVRKGTLGAFIANAKLLESMSASDPRYAAIEAELRALAPAVRAVGLLDIFEPRSSHIAAMLADSAEKQPSES